MPLRPWVFMTIRTAGPTIRAAAVPAARHAPPPSCWRSRAGCTRAIAAASGAKSRSASQINSGAIRKNPSIRHGRPRTKCDHSRTVFSWNSDTGSTPIGGHSSRASTRTNATPINATRHGGPAGGGSACGRIAASGSTRDACHAGSADAPSAATVMPTAAATMPIQPTAMPPLKTSA